MDSGYYAACAGLRARTQTLEIVANNLANLNTSGYSSSQVDQRKVGKLATAIQAALQQLGVFPGSGNVVVADPSQPISFNTVQAIEDAERSAALGHLASVKRFRAPLKMATCPVCAKNLRTHSRPRSKRTKWL